MVNCKELQTTITSALELQRVDKVIGSSLEAAPTVHVQDKDALSVLESVPFQDICITSDIKLTSANPLKTHTGQVKLMALQLISEIGWNEM